MTAVVRQCQRRLEPEEGLVLHARVIGPFDHDVTGGRRVAADDPLVA
jgi:hypothetical protein